MKFDHNNKKTVLTGGSRGIGKVVAKHLVQSGANLNIIARTETELLKTEEEFSRQGFGIKSFKGDVLDIERIGEIVSSIGNVDVLVNCAGVQGEIGPFYDLN